MFLRCALALAVLGLAVPAWAKPSEQWTLYVSNLGLPNYYARAAAPYLEKYLPDRPTIIVREMPGAGGATLCRHLASAPKDGTVAGIASGVISRAMRGDPSVACADQLMLAGLWSDSRVLIAGRKALGTAPADVLNRLVSGSFRRSPAFASGVPGGLGTVFVEAFLRSLGVVPNIVSGYRSTKEAVLAVERGEADLALVRFSDLPNAAGGNLLEVCTLGGGTDSELSACGPLVRRLHPEADPELLGALWFVEEAVALSEPVFLPQGLPPEKARAWENALRRTAADEEFLARLRKGKLNAAFLDGPAARAQLSAVQKRLLMEPKLLKRVDALAKGN